ncbi:MAG: hypothetical protein BroJett002_37030 [Candidatus Brocadia sinica]|nr:MAG: hypothetical protein BroJett002_37030 [Candidatus Brocadia sinica]
MKRIILIILFTVCFSSIAHAERRTILYESIVVGTSTAISSSATLDAALYDAYRSVQGLATVEGNNIRYQCDGTAPTTTEGLLAYVGDAITIEGIIDVRNFSCIGIAGTATVKINYTADIQ